jgi:hypothetical protein
MPTQQVCFWAANAGVGVSHWAAETIGIWQDKGGLTTQQIDQQVREGVSNIAQSMSMINKQGKGPEQRNLLIELCVTRDRNLEFNRPHWKRCMADKTELNYVKLNAPMGKIAEVGLHRRTIRLEDTPTK